jgi:hypothetical protein
MQLEPRAIDLMEKRLLQIVIALAALVPVVVGLAGAIWGPAMGAGSIIGFGDSQFRYLSGVLVGVGAAYWMLVPTIEKEGERLFMLTLIVVIGGFCRASSLLLGGPAGAAVYIGLVMELIVAPGAYLWQMRLARLAAMDRAPPPRASMDARGPWG